MELPHALRTTLGTLTAAVPYVQTPVSIAPRQRGDELAVGVAWAAGAGWDLRRTIPVSLLEPLTRVSGVSLQGLQQGPARGEWPEEWGTLTGSRQLEGLAAVMRSLDLVITVDSLPAHLAGALGVPTWTLLHADPDWRWMLETNKSPWYPTMRLFRQRTDGEWGPVIADVADALAKFVQETHRIRGQIGQ